MLLYSQSTRQQSLNQRTFQRPQLATAMTNQRYRTSSAPENHLNSNNILSGDSPSEATDNPKENDANDATAELVRGPSKGGEEAF